MQLSILHATSYRYSHPVHYSIQSLHLSPRSDAKQQVRNWSIDAPGQMTQQVDGFGNIQHILVRNDVHEDVTVTVTGVVDSMDTSGVVTEHALEDLLPREIYLRPTALTQPGEPVQDFAEPLAPAFAADPLDGLHQLSRAVAQAVNYQKGMTHVNSTADEVLMAGTGVCQDQAHVFTAAARCLGVPTRYVSGYVHVEGEGADETASHAWAESWVENLGWVAFDITNEICPADAHVRLAVGPDYSYCAPVRGVRRGGGIEDMDVQVSVAATQ
ncbi:MAG TPA: transglutaminase family protein [Alphaproteobacteria bacterium]|nr:transglutaminase family protein [Alphaproteobacteria bacterium]